jgi:hypothetical protein
VQLRGRVAHHLDLKSVLSRQCKINPSFVFKCWTL